MIVGNCTHCRGIVRIPVEAAPTASVRCPLCGQTDLLQAHLETTIPQLEIIDGNSTDSSVESTEEIKIRTMDESGKFNVPSALSRGAVRRRRRSRNGSSSGDMAVIESPGGGDLASTESAVESVNSRREAEQQRESQRRRRRSRKRVVRRGGEIVKIIMGGVLALPVAQLIIWWGVGVDPLNTGPATSRVIPVIVPEQFHEQEPNLEDLVGE